jgi:hypothetical protein
VRTFSVNMFRFLTGLSSERGNPLQTQKSASVWFRQLPAADPIGRQLEVIRALDEVTQATKRPDFACVAAIRYLDAESGPTAASSSPSTSKASVDASRWRIGSGRPRTTSARDSLAPIGSS